MKTGFYNIGALDTPTLIMFYNRAVELAYDVHIDKLDCEISWQRQTSTEKTIGDMIKNANKSYHNICIDRSIQHDKSLYGEIGYTIISDKYFLYIF